MSRIVIDENRCKGCGLCTLVCPYDLVSISSHFNEKGYRPADWVDAEGQCIACASCATMCPDVAITVYRLPKRRSSGRAKRTESRPEREKVQEK